MVKSHFQNRASIGCTLTLLGVGFQCSMLIYVFGGFLGYRPDYPVLFDYSYRLGVGLSILGLAVYSVAQQRSIVTTIGASVVPLFIPVLGPLIVLYVLTVRGSEKNASGFLQVKSMSLSKFLVWLGVILFILLPSILLLLDLLR